MVENFLTLEEELTYGRIIKHARENPNDYNKDEYKNAVDVLYRNNERGAFSVVHSFFSRRSGVFQFYPIEDALQDASLELARFIIDKYDPDRGFKVLTGATPFIKKILTVSVQKYKSLPMKAVGGGKYSVVSDKVKEYEELEEKPCTLIQYVMDNTSYKYDDVVQLLYVLKGVSSFDYPIGVSEDGTTDCLFDIVPDDKVATEYEAIENNSLLFSMISQLDDKEAKALLYKYDVLPNSEVDLFLEEYELTKNEYNKLARKGLKKLKELTAQKQWKY